MGRSLADSVPACLAHIPGVDAQRHVKADVGMGMQGCGGPCHPWWPRAYEASLGRVRPRLKTEAKPKQTRMGKGIIFLCQKRHLSQ